VASDLAEFLMQDFFRRQEANTSKEARVPLCIAQNRQENCFIKMGLLSGIVSQAERIEGAKNGSDFKEAEKVLQSLKRRKLSSHVISSSLI
jgi:hypothetical protein